MFSGFKYYHNPKHSRTRIPLFLYYFILGGKGGGGLLIYTKILFACLILFKYATSGAVNISKIS